MEHVTAKVSYRDKESGATVELEAVELDVPTTVEEAVEKFGEKPLIDYAVKAYIIEEQRKSRDAARPDRPKSTSNLSKFKQLSEDKQDELLKASGIL